MPRPSRTLRIGDVAPGFTLTDPLAAAEWTLDTLVKESRGLLLVFHRGLW